MQKMKLFLNDQGTSTLEFAIIFPVVFFIVFISLLLLFWVGVAIIITYETSRLNRLQSVGINLVSTDPVYQKLAKIPSLNKFTSTTFHQDIIINSDLTILRTTISSTNPTITPYLIQLALGSPSEVNKTLFQTMNTTAYRIKEPYSLTGTP
jgi:hypothetical protein